MESAAGQPVSRTVPSPERQNALLTLLADEDPAVSIAIERQLLVDGTASLEWLRRHRVHSDPTIRRRVRELLLRQDRAEADLAFLNYCHRHGEHFDLEEAVWVFVRTRNPDANIPAYRAQLDEWAEECRSLIEGAEGGAQVIQGLNRVLFQTHGFHGNGDDYYDPLNSYLDTVIDRRRGIPITLSCVYQFVARRLGLPVVGIGMPGHFLCRYQTAQEELFLDPFHAGALVSRGEARRRLEHFTLNDLESHLQPISARRCLQRMISNLHIIHRERRESETTLRLQRYLMVLSR
jgi:regulator of sirC expression with transglutaminase-like and TPR domain